MTYWIFTIVMNFRCIWLGFLRMVMNWCARVCFHTQMRSGTSLLAPSINAFSPPSFLLVTYENQLSLCFSFLLIICFLHCAGTVSNAMIFLFPSMKVNPMRQQYGKFRNFMANLIPLNWSELLPLMATIQRLSGEIIFSHCKLLTRLLLELELDNFLS